MINCCSNIRENEEEAKQIKPGGAWCVFCFKYLQAKNIPFIFIRIFQPVKHTHPYNLSEGGLFRYSLLFAIVTELDESLSFWHPLFIDGIWWQHLALLICNSGYTIYALSLRTLVLPAYSV